MPEYVVRCLLGDRSTDTSWATSSADIVVYPEAGHSYMSRHEGVFATIAAWGPLAAGHDARAEGDSWTRIERFFRSHLE